MSSALRKPMALTGAGLLFLTFLKSLSLAQGSPTARLAVGFCLFTLAGLALFLVSHEGYQCEELISLLLPLGLALFLRVMLLDHVTLDYQNFLSHWVEHFRSNGGFSAIKDPVGNYNVPYLYILALISYLPIPDLYCIKLFSILFDILLAWGGLRLTKILSSQGTLPLRTFSLLLLLPTVILNSACWGQCDSIWSAFCLLSLSYALENRPVRSLSLLAVAFSFKLQAIFIIPLWCVFWFCGKVKFRHLLVFPGVFIVTMLPALLVGKPIQDILSVYLNQTSDSISWSTVNYNSPSIFTLLPYHSEPTPQLPKLAILLAFLFMLTILLFLFLHKERVNNTVLVLVGTAFSLGIPFLLPYMHERYFYLGGILLAVLAGIIPSMIPAALSAELASLGGYHAYLLTRYALVIRLGSITWTQLMEGLLMLFAVGFTLYTLKKRLP